MTVTLIHLLCTVLVGLLASKLVPVADESEGGDDAERISLGLVEDDLLGFQSFKVAKVPYLAPAGGATACCGFERVMRWLPFTATFFYWYHVPLALAYWGNVIFNNLSFVDLEVDFLQMLKATGPAWVLLITVALGTQRASWTLVAIITLIVGGTSLASYGELHFSLRGFFFAISATILSALRTAFIERTELAAPIDGRQLFAYTSPFTLALVFIVWVPLELKRLVARLTDGQTHANAQLAWVLLISIVLANISNYGRYLWIKSSSSIIYAVTGVMKDIAVIVFSLVFLGDSITKIKLLGASIAFSGVIWFTVLEAKTHSTTKHALSPADQYSRLDVRFADDDDENDDVRHLHFDGAFAPLQTDVSPRGGARANAISPTLFSDDENAQPMADLLGAPVLGGL